MPYSDIFPVGQGLEVIGNNAIRAQPTLAGVVLAKLAIEQWRKQVVLIDFIRTAPWMALGMAAVLLLFALEHVVSP